MFALIETIACRGLTVTQALTSSVLLGHNSWQEQPYYVYSCSTFTGATGR